MYILGLSFSFHDSNAALLYNFSIIGHLEEERFNRIKHTELFPINSINILLNRANISINDIDIIAYDDIIDLTKLKQNLIKNYNIDINKFKFICCDHHIAHIYNSYCYSNFQSCACIAVDGAGSNNNAITIAKMYKNNIKILKTYSINESLGFLYELAAIFCGYDENSCGKIMGLAAFGIPQNIEPYFISTNDIFHINQKYEYSYINTQNIQNISKLFNYIKKDIDLKIIYNVYGNNKQYQLSVFKIIQFLKLLYPFCKNTNSNNIIYYQNFAATIQKILNDSMLSLVKITKKLTNETNLILSGGTIQNCISNENIIQSNIFNNVYCCPTPGDNGIAIGCALYVAHLNNYNIYMKNIKNAYFGEKYNILNISKLFLNKIQISNCTYDDIINDLINNKIIGWFQDESEIGPRALCHRSIIANPSNRQNLYIINNNIKNREIYRPLAPVVLDKFFFNIFDGNKIDMTNFMLRTLIIKKEYRKKLCAVCHIDNTSRPQYLTKEINIKIYNLIEKFYYKTQIPCLINTSFNRRNEPIVETINDAINMLLNTKHLDYIVFNTNIKLSRK